MPSKSRWMWRSSLVVLVLVIMLGATAPPIPSAGVLPNISVTVTEPDPVVIGPDDYVHVAVDGEVSYGGLTKNTVIEVDANTDNYWCVTVVPDKVTVTGSFPASGKFKLAIDVKVPPGAAADRPATLNVEAIATTPPPISINTTGMASTTIKVKQYYGLQLDTNHTVAVEQGKAQVNRFRVTNTGNGPDNYTIALTNGAAMDARGLRLQFDAGILNLGQNRALNVRVDINASANATVGMTAAVFKVTSAGDPAQTGTFTLTVIVQQGQSTDGGGDGGGGGSKKKAPGLEAAVSMTALMAVAFALVASRRRRA